MPASRDHEGRVIDFGRTAADYDRYRPGFPESFFERVTSPGWIATGQRALDLGTGTGGLALGLARRGLHVTGIDPATELLEVARNRATAADLDATFVEGVAEDTRLPTNSFDLVTAGQCWWWFDERAVIAEARRVLVPGGRLLIATFSYLPIPGSVAERTEALVLRHNPGWAKAGGTGVHPEFVVALDRAGFADVESVGYTQEVTFTHEAWRGRVRACNGVGASLRPDQVAAFDDDLASVLASDWPEKLTIRHRIFVVTATV